MRNRTRNHARPCERLFLVDHFPALVADLVLVVLKAGQQNARIIALALAELDHVGAAGGTLLSMFLTFDASLGVIFTRMPALSYRASAPPRESVETPHALCPRAHEVQKAR